MPVMSSADRIATGALFQSDASARREGLGAVTKQDVQAAIAAVDDWVIANQASFNSTLPLVVRNAFTQAQKAALLLYVVRKRYEVGA